MTHHKYRLNYFIDRADAQPLTDADVSALEDDLWDVMVAWLEERGLRMNGGSGMTVPAGDD